MKLIYNTVSEMIASTLSVSFLSKNSKTMISNKLICEKTKQGEISNNYVVRILSERSER